MHSETIAIQLEHKRRDNKKGTLFMQLGLLDKLRGVNPCFTTFPMSTLHCYTLLGIPKKGNRVMNVDTSSRVQSARPSIPPVQQDTAVFQA